MFKSTNKQTKYNYTERGRQGSQHISKDGKRNPEHGWLALLNNTTKKKKEKKENLTKSNTEKHPTPIKSTSNLNLINKEFYKNPINIKITQPGLLLWLHKFEYTKAVNM